MVTSWVSPTWPTPSVVTRLADVDVLVVGGRDAAGFRPSFAVNWRAPSPALLRCWKYRARASLTGDVLDDRGEFVEGCRGAVSQSDVDTELVMAAS